MALKIYKKGAYVVINNSGKLTELNSANVSITKDTEEIDIYEVKHNGVPVLKAQLSDILDENGVAYVEAAWDIFRYEQTGSVNSSEVANPYPAPTTTVVNISSAQILAMGTIGVELLPAPAANEYYDIEKIILEYTHVTTAYTLADPYINFGMALPSINSYILTGGVDQSFVINNSSSYSDAIEEVSHVGNSILGQSLGLYTWNGTNPTLGDGTLRAIITYTTRTFGA